MSVYYKSVEVACPRMLADDRYVTLDEFACIVPAGIVRDGLQVSVLCAFDDHAECSLLGPANDADPRVQEEILAAAIVADEDREFPVVAFEGMAAYDFDHLAPNVAFESPDDTSLWHAGWLAAAMVDPEFGVSS